MIEFRQLSELEWLMIDTSHDDLPILRIVADEFGRSCMIYPEGGFKGVPVEYLKDAQDASFRLGAFVRQTKDRTGVVFH